MLWRFPNLINRHKKTVGICYIMTYAQPDVSLTKYLKFKQENSIKFNLELLSDLLDYRSLKLVSSFNTYICIYLFFKAILQVLIYKALYDSSYLGSKTTMTSGEWTCLISFATAPLTCSERGGSEKFKMKIYVSSGIRTHTPPVHDRKVAAP